MSMKVVVFSHKLCWRSDVSLSGYATDGGFPFQMRAIAEIFDETAIVVPVSNDGDHGGEAPLEGEKMRVVAVRPPYGRGWQRKLAMLGWCFMSAPVIVRELLRADAVHAPIPGDIGTIGMLAAWLLRKPLIVRHCGNWLLPRTTAEHFWRWFMERFAGGRNIMLATGGGPEPPSRNPHVRWIFSTSVSERELTSLRETRSVAPEPRLIIACRQERSKGTGIVIEALPLIAKDFPGVTLDVLGAGSALNEFRELAKRLGVQHRVHFHGRVDHERVLQLLRNASLFCYPTRASEGFPKVVLEALACGLPVITTRVSVLPQLLAEGCGVLLDAATPEAAAAAVRLCLSDSRQYVAMSNHALETARQYSLENWRDTLRNLMRSTWGADAIRA
jgi:glycosyltransferase involved in cell wall biosynthesis